MDFHLQTLRSRLIVLLLLVALPGMGLLVFSALDERSEVISSARQRAVAAANLLASDQSRLITRTHSYLQRLAQFPEVLQPDSAECGAFLARQLSLIQDYINLGVPRADGELLCNALPLIKHINVADRGYIRQTIATRRFAIGEFQMDRAAGVTSVNFSYPVVDPATDQLVGIAVAVVSLDWWSKRLAEIQLPGESIAYILGAGEKIVAHYPPDRDRLGLRLEEVGIYPDTTADSSGVVVFFSQEEGGERTVFASRRLISSNSSQPVMVGVGVAFEKQLQQIESRLIQQGLMMLVITALLFADALWAVGVSVLKPVQILARITRELESGRVMAASQKLGAAELIDLQESFQRMAQTRLNTEKLLRDSRAQLINSENYNRSLFEATPLGLSLSDIQGNFIDYNSAFLRIIGRSAEEMKGLSQRDVTPREEWQLDELEMRQLEFTGSSGPYDKTYLKQNGHRVPVRVSATVHERAGERLILSTIEDITEHNRTQEELLRLRKYQSNIIDLMPSMLIGVDRDSVITQWNAEAARVTGVSSSQAIGQPLEQMLPRLASLRPHVAAALQTQKKQVDLKRLSYSSSKVVYEDVTIYPLTTGGIEGVIIRLDDVSERVQLEEMLVQNEKMLSVGGLAAGIAHEINNPLAGMMQSASVITNRLERGDLPANQQAARAAGTRMEAITSFMTARGILDMLRAINESGQRLSRIVENMLSFAHKSDKAHVYLDLTQLMEKAIQLAVVDYDLQRQYDFKGIRLVREYQDNLPEICCEGTMIQQVFLNVLRNAAQAMHEAQLERPVITLRIACPAGSSGVQIEIEDNGPGMDEMTSKRIFEPFYTTKRLGLGTGLGLSVSYFIITEYHAGTMSVESVPGHGSRFIIRLP